MNRRLVAGLALLLAAAPAGTARAQAPADSVAAAIARADSLAAAARADSAAAWRRARSLRASWLTDRLPLEVGDLLTVIVDEETVAKERVSTVATAQRGQSAELNGGISTDARVGPWKAFGSTLDNDSRDVGEAGRSGGLTAVLTVRVLEVAPNGVARISGGKKVVVDGRPQEVRLTGWVRSEDVDIRHQVSSGSIADAVIEYKGKKIGPRSGILGNILNILWP